MSIERSVVHAFAAAAFTTFALWTSGSAAAQQLRELTTVSTLAGTGAPGYTLGRNGSFAMPTGLRANFRAKAPTSSLTIAAAKSRPTR